MNKKNEQKTNSIKVLNAIAGSEETPLTLGDISIPCYVLEDETRVLSGKGIQDAVGFPKNSSGTALGKLIFSDKLSHLVTQEIREKFQNRIPFKRVGSGGSVPQTYGYDATLLIDICDLIIQARKENLLTPKQEMYAEQCEIIIRAVAKVGIISLIDEATGYQEKRPGNALKKLLEKYLQEEYAIWTKRFPDEFFKEIFRLRGWEYVPGEVKRPGVVGRWINDIVYERLAPGILEELQRLNPKNESGNRAVRHHQFLTDDIGHPALSQHIYAILGLMRASNDWDSFYTILNKAYPKKNTQMLFDFEYGE